MRGQRQPLIVQLLGGAVGGWRRLQPVQRGLASVRHNLMLGRSFATIVALLLRNARPVELRDGLDRLDSSEGAGGAGGGLEIATGGNTGPIVGGASCCSIGCMGEDDEDVLEDLEA